MAAAETTVLDALYDDGGVQADDTALSSLSGQGQAALPGAIMNAFSGFADAMFDRQDMLLTEGAQAQGALAPGLVLSYADAGPSAKAGLAGDPFGDVRAAAVGPYGQWATWGHAYDRWSNVGGAGGLPGAASHGAGFVAGADRYFSNDLVAGAAVGYSRTSTTSAGVSGATDVWAGGLYATWTPGAFVFDGRLAAGAATTPLSRAIAFPGEAITATSKANGWGGLVAGEAGYRFAIPGVTLEPYVGLTDQVLRQDAFTESTDFGLSFPAQTYVKTTTAVGALATTTFQLGGVTVMPQAKLAWTHDLRNDTLTTQAALFDAPFSISAANPGRDAAVVGLKLAAWRTESVDVFAGYTGEFRSNAVSQQVFGGLRVFW